MQVYQVRVKLYLMEDITTRSVSQKITAFIDQALLTDEKLAEMHSAREFKFYVFDQLFPCESDKIYKKDKIYTVTIRTVKSELADFFVNRLIHTHTEFLKGLTGELRIIPQRNLELIYSLTPVIVKPAGGGYWKGKISFSEYERLIFENLIKKWNAFQNEKINEDFQLYTLMELQNETALPVSYKNVVLQGDKFCLHVADNSKAQQLAYFSLGTGLGTMNARGAGYMNYRYL